MADSLHTDKVTACNICGSINLSVQLRRSDNLAVLICGDCGMGVLEKFPEDPSAFYGDAYYVASEVDCSAGYHDYDVSSEHGVLWAGELLKLIKPEGRVLDIGCANGFLLQSLSSDYQIYGIEANEKASMAAESAGAKIIGNDILDPSLLEDYSAFFDAVTAIAVFEHISDFRGAIAASLEMLKHSGILVFEVPLLSENNNNDTWLRSSLEHLYYPTTRGIRHLFEVELMTPMIGCEVVIKDYASNFIGLASNDKSVFSRVKYIFEQVFYAPPENLSSELRRTQLLLRVVHAADSGPQQLQFVDELFPLRHQTPFLSRCLDLWKADSARLESARNYLVQVEEARSWHAQRAAVALCERDALLPERDALLARRDALTAERDSLLARRDALTAERDALVSEHDNVLAERDALRSELYRVYHSRSWRILAPVRKIASGVKSSIRTLLTVSLRAAAFFSLSKTKRVLGLLISGNFLELRAGVLYRFRRFGKAVRQARIPEAIQGRPLLAGQPLVSVVIPCFNYGRFVPDAIDSVLRQTLKNVEVIVVDGGSTDGSTVDLLRATQRPRTRVFLREGRHLVGDNRNFGIKEACGRYICCLDADDTLDPTYLEKSVYFLETFAFDVVSTSINFIGAKEGHVDTLERPDLKDMTTANHVLTCAVFRRELWESSGGYVDVGIGRDHVAEDWDFWLRLSANGARIRNISREYLFNYRIHEGGSLSSSADVKSLLEQKQEILARNREALTPAAFKLSERQHARYIRCDPTRTALASCQGSTDHCAALLLAMPYSLVGGAERLLSGLCAYLSAKEWRVIVITTLPQECQHGDSLEWFKGSTTEVYALAHFLEPQEMSDFVAYLLTSRRVDCLLNTGSRLVYELLPSLRDSHPRLTVVDLLFNTVGHTESHRKYKDYISFALAESQEVFDWYETIAKWPRQRLAKVSSGVDLSRFRPVVPPTEPVVTDNVDAADLIIGYSGRLSEEKAPDVFVEVARLCQGAPNIRFVMTGAGPLADKIAQQVEALPPAVRFEFAGLVEDIREYIAHYDLLVLPSRFDGRPLVVMEALACGVPVIASDVGGLRDLVEEGRNGYLVRPADAQMIADRILRLAEDRVLLATLKHNARELAEGKLNAEVAYGDYEIALRKAMCIGNGFS